MADPLPVACNSCIHRITGTACEAFDEIPGAILQFGDPHNEKFPEQSNGVVWEFAPGTEDEFDRWKTVLETVV